VTEQRAKQLSQPKIGPLAQPQQKNAPNTSPFEPPTPTPPAVQTKQDGKRKVRVVGPQFYPVAR
jgi:hypothetical protein